ncbi:MAG: SurA N-terminal domain-containing protein [Rickettsiales bacterium]|nr:SurA N-terminal domain-containing protein [Rickettsiales bacterium]
MIKTLFALLVLFIALPAFAEEEAGGEVMEEAAEESAAEAEEEQVIASVQKQAPSNHYTVMAVVNDDVISSLDVEERLRLIISTSGRPDTPETRRMIAPRIVSSLVEERLKLQAARQQNIMISKKDIDAAISRIEQAQGKDKGSLESLLEQNDLSLVSFHQQVKSEVAWNKILARKIRRNVIISEEEITRSQKRLAAGKKVEEWQIASLSFPAASAEELSVIEPAVVGLREELIKGKALTEVVQDYPKLKMQVAPSAWIRRDMLNPMVEKVLQTLEKGGIAPPARTPEGLQLIRLLDRRSRLVKPNANAEVALKQIILKMGEKSSDFEIDVMMDVARSIAKYPGSCLHKGVAGTENFEGLDIDVNYIRTTLANMSAELRPMVEPMNVSQITEPFAAPDGIHMLMLCERIEMPAPLPEKEEVRQVLFQEKLQLEAEKYLRSLKRDAFIDIRV